MTIFKTPELFLDIIFGNELLGSVWQCSCKMLVLCSVTASAESCCLQTLVHVGLILSSWIIPSWLKHVHKFSRIKACLCTNWFLGEHIHILESSPCKLIAQTKHAKISSAPFTTVWQFLWFKCTLLAIHCCGFPSVFVQLLSHKGKQNAEIKRYLSYKQHGILTCLEILQRLSVL